MEQLDRDLEALRRGAPAWAAMRIEQRIALLEEVRPLAGRYAQEWVQAAVAAKGLPARSPLTGEEWISGPYGVLYGINRYIRTLRQFQRTGDVQIPGPVRKRADGTNVARVFPVDAYDKMIFSGITADVWLPEHFSTARFYRTQEHLPRVALVLGAGNVAAIGPLDVLYKLIAQGAVCMLKMNPVNEYLAPVFRKIFAPFIARDFLRVVTGGVDVGEYLTAHTEVDEIHITGSAQTHDAIVFGSPLKTQRRIEKPVSSELGNVSPTIVVPGKWTAADLRFQAENVVTQKMHNAGFNCIASQVLILPQTWEQRADFERELEGAFARIERRPAYYPGAEVRRSRIAGTDPGPVIRVDSSAPHEAFTTEAFAAVLAMTTLPGDDAQTFLTNAVRFANERLAGTLGANLIVDPATRRAIGAHFDDAIAALRYGAIGVNAWTGVAFLLAESTWGAYPGHTLEDIQSGIGIVHNAFLFDRAYKTVVTAPFRPFPRGLAHGSAALLPKPPWFVTNTQAAEIGRRLVEFEAAPSPLKIPGLFLSALRG